MNKPDWVRKNLDNKLMEGNYRKLKSLDFNSSNNFSSNDYLALSEHKKIVSELNIIDKIGTCASRLLAANAQESLLLEEELAEYFEFETSLLFSSGFLANVGLIATLVRREDVVFSDKLIHSSLIQGIKLAGSKHLRFKHNDFAHLEKFLSQQYSKRKVGQCFYIVVESLYSMDGDSPNFDLLSELSRKFDCTLIVDEAHAVGVYEKGLTRNINKENTVITGTFSKAFGTYGGFVCGPNWLKELLINNCKTFIYNTTLPQILVSATRKSLNIVKQNPELGKNLILNSIYFRKELSTEHHGIGHIVSLPMDSSNDALKLSQLLLEKGFLVPAIRPPTVNQAILRISITLHHEKIKLEELSNAIKVSL